MYKDNKISVVVPAYNEEKLISKTINAVPDFVDKIIVIDETAESESAETLVESDTDTPKVPEWVKNNAEWWYLGALSEDEFLASIEYLVKEDIIQV